MAVENNTGIVTGFEMSKGANTHSGLLAGQALLATMQTMRTRPAASDTSDFRKRNTVAFRRLPPVHAINQ